VSAELDETSSTWTVTTESGESLTARHVVMATGCLSAAIVPEFDGLSDFQGEVHHTAAWPAEPVDMRGKRVGVIGTGSSGVQVISTIGSDVSELHVFQRTPNHVVPAQNRPMDDAWREELKRSVADRRTAAANTYFGISLEESARMTADATPEEREREYQRRWDEGGLNMLLSFADVMLDEQANREVADFIKRKVRETVKDPVVAEKLVPGDHPVGTKRICVGTDYYETYNRDNVTLHDARDEEIVGFTPTGVRTATGHVDLDVVILATGFDAFTGAISRIDVRGRDGRALKDKWASGPVTYLGLGTAGFPNFFVVAGPGSPSVLSNMPISCQQHGQWIAEAIATLRDRGIATIEVDPAAEEAWTAHLIEVAGFTLHRLGHSWYQGANVPGKPQVFMTYLGGVPGYTAKLAEVAGNGYEGFVLASAHTNEEVPV
jgi:cyclohexanone monooxygenase